MKTRLCRWCKTPTVRHCGICQQCIERRDAYDKLIDEGKAPYIPPEKRPGHRFYERKRMSSAKQTAFAKAQAARNAVLARPKAQGQAQ